MLSTDAFCAPKGNDKHDGTDPDREFVCTSKVVKLVKLQKDAGSDPVNLLRLTLKNDNFFKAPT
jgi:hypothetical protein